MTLVGITSELYRRSPALTGVGWFCVVILAGCLLGMLFDSRTILGINPWIKPAKFALSITIFVWTLAWLVDYLPRRSAIASVASLGVAVAMVIEIVCIVLQSARGVRSHFNSDTPLDAGIFSLMGLVILFNTLCVGVVLLLFLIHRANLPTAYWLGICLGLAIFILASLEAGFMIRQQGHTVGADDGGPGLPFVNWSAQAGDLRIAHFVGLHALQVLPFVGWWVTSKESWSPTLQVTLVLLIAVVWSGLTLSTLLVALAGRPLLPR